MQAIPQASKAKLTYDLTLEQADLILTALSVLDSFHEAQHPDLAGYLQQAAKHFPLETLPDLKSHLLGLTVDHIWDAVYDVRYMTPFDHLVNCGLDPESASDDEIRRVVADIEQQYGKIELPEVSA